MGRTILGFTAWVVLATMVWGCADGPASPSGLPTVTFVSSFTQGSSPATLQKAPGIFGVDSIVIDSAVVILARIKFESHVDSAHVDSSEHEELEAEEGEEERNVVLRGPFVVHVRDSAAIDFASQELPAGTYDGIKFKVHRLQPGEHHEDSDEREGHHRVVMADLPYGSSIMIWGSVWKDSTWIPFTYAYDGELEFKVKGDFTVPAATSRVSFALNFNIGVWFTTPTGSILDPTDPSLSIRELIRQSIKRSFEQCRGGRDRDEDGHPDD